MADSLNLLPRLHRHFGDRDARRLRDDTPGEFWEQFFSRQHLPLNSPWDLDPMLRQELQQWDVNRFGSPGLTLGRCWELLERRWRERAENPALDTSREEIFVQVLERLLDEGDQVDQVLQQLGALDLSLSRSRFQVQLAIRQPAQQPLPAGCTLQLEVTARPEWYSEWLRVFVFQIDSQQQARLLFPNLRDASGSRLVPGVPLRIPETGLGYQLAAPSRPGSYRLRVIATNKDVSLPVDYRRGETFAVREQHADGVRLDPWRQFRDRRQAAYRKLLRLWDQALGCVAGADLEYEVA